MIGRIIAPPAQMMFTPENDSNEILTQGSMNRRAASRRRAGCPAAFPLDVCTSAEWMPSNYRATLQGAGSVPHGVL
jgi:hypothetical protein